jgi:hypothetical protein
MLEVAGLTLLQRDRYDDLFEWSDPHARAAPSLRKRDLAGVLPKLVANVDQMWLSADRKPNALATMKWVVLINGRMNRHAE